MKKIISLLVAVVLVVSMCSMSVFAADVRTVTLSASATDNKANVGEEFIVSAILDTTNGVKTLGVKIAFDANDIELGTSDEADAVAAEYADYIGTPEYPTLDSVCLEALGRASYVDDGYYATYGSYAANKNLGTATIGYEEKEGNGIVGFGYAITTAKGNLNKVVDMHVAGAVLKVKTTEKKQTTITLYEPGYSGADNALVEYNYNTITLNLNGYGEVVEPEVPTAEDIGLVTENGKALKNVEVTNVDGSKYTVKSALAFVSCVDTAKATPVKTVITRADSDKELVIDATNTAEYGDKTYFAAAVTSIKESSFNKTFTAIAYAQAGDYTVEGAAATGTYAE